MGGHRFELCLAQEPLPPAEAGNNLPSIGFAVSEETLEQVIGQLREANVAFDGPLTYPEPIPLKRTIRVHDPDGNTIEFSVRK
jgi:hypothetical protein